MKQANNTNPYYGSPHMTQEEVNAFMEDMLRKDFGERAEIYIMLARTLQKMMADMHADKANSSESKK